MNRRHFLQMLGIAPLAAKVAMSDALLDNLSSAYDYRFGNPAPPSLYGINVLQTTDYIGTYLGLSRKDYPGCIALQLEKIRKEIPAIFKCEKALLDLIKQPEPMHSVLVLNEDPRAAWEAVAP